MNNLWRFSLSSKELLQQCMASSTSHEPNEKWLQKFKHVNSKNDLLIDNTNLVIEVNDSESPKITEESPDIEVMDVIMENVDENVFIETVECEGIKKLEYIIEKCLQNRNLMVIMAERLSHSCIERICKHIFAIDNINSQFLNDYYLYFMPAFFVKNHNLQGLHILKQAKSHTELFNKLLIIIIKNDQIPSDFLLSFISNCSIEEKKQFLYNLMNTELTNNEIAHNLLILQECYKYCNKDITIGNFILNILTKISQNCTTDKNYGKFLLLFLQNNEIKNNKLLETLVEVHQSPFKKACLTVLKRKQQKYIIY